MDRNLPSPEILKQIDRIIDDLKDLKTELCGLKPLKRVNPRSGKKERATASVREAKRSATSEVSDSERSASEQVPLPLAPVGRSVSLPNATQKEESQSDRGVSTLKVRSVPTEQLTEATKDPAVASRFQRVVDMLAQAFERTRGYKYGFTPRDGKAAKALLTFTDSDYEIETRFIRGLRNTKWPQINTIHALQLFWNDLAHVNFAPVDTKGWVGVDDAK